MLLCDIYCYLRVRTDDTESRWLHGEEKVIDTGKDTAHVGVNCSPLRKRCASPDVHNMQVT